MLLGQRIKTEREKLAWTQDALADKLNISRQAISKWELGTAYPDVERLVQMSDLFQVSLDSLVRGVDAPASPATAAPTTPTMPEHHLNFWEFAAKYWWLIFAIGGWLTWFVPEIVRAFK